MGIIRIFFFSYFVSLSLSIGSHPSRGFEPLLGWHRIFFFFFVSSFVSLHSLF